MTGVFNISKLPVSPAILAAAILCFPPAVHSAGAAPEGLRPVNPEAAGFSACSLDPIDAAVAASMEAGEIPGAVVLVARHGRIAYFKAFGHRSLRPAREPMTVDTIFDMSSLTKVMATTPSIMLLVESGSLRLADKVWRYLPKFSGGNKESVTVSQLLTHYSGLRPDFDLSRQWFGYSDALEELWKARADSEPGKEFRYSDINFIALGEIVRTLSGKTLDLFAREHIFDPLGMADTLFRPPETMKGRIAPTEPRANTLQYLKGKLPQNSWDRMLRGEVHDPTAWRMGGVAGHAGLFSSARDLAVYAQMLLNKGTYKGVRLLSPQSVRAMTAPQSPRGSPDIRGYGWDLESGYSAPRGDIFEGGFGHSGFTGTSLWIHPPTDSFVLLLCNRVHPNGGKDINHLRAVIANIVAAAIINHPDE